MFFPFIIGGTRQLQSGNTCFVLGGAETLYLVGLAQTAMCHYTVSTYNGDMAFHQ